PKPFTAGANCAILNLDRDAELRVAVGPESVGLFPADCPRPSRKERTHMPRKKLIRRFEPRYGVNQEMINTEAKYVARELDDHLLLSIDDLSKSLAQLR